MVSHGWAFHGLDADAVHRPSSATKILSRILRIRSRDFALDSSRLSWLTCLSNCASSGESGGWPLINRSLVDLPRARSRTEYALYVFLKWSATKAKCSV